MEIPSANCAGTAKPTRRRSALGCTRPADRQASLKQPVRPPARAPQRNSRWKRVVLLGFMTSGKSQVGRVLASRLRWRHIDLDSEIERRAGAKVEKIFADRGEEGFRQMEVDLTPEIMAAENIVVSPGGGWITNPGLLESLPPDTLTVWLKVSPEEVLRRLATSRSRQVRPLLREADTARVEQLLAVREPMYARAAAHISTDRRSVSEIAIDLVKFMRGSSPPSINFES